jgi:hypothetical protein
MAGSKVMRGVDLLMMRGFALIILALALASCQVLGRESGGQEQNAQAPSVIRWDRSPSTVVFRVDVTGGEQASSFYALGEIPPCTIYGDGRVIWTTEASSYETQVLIDRVDDDAIREFVEFLAYQERIFSYEAEADLLPPADIVPVVETITLSINDRTHVTDSFSGWDIDYFRNVLDACRELSPTPAIYEPPGAWLSVIEVSYNSNLPFIQWNADASGLNLAGTATSDEPQWITGQNLRVLWNLLLRSRPDVQFGQAEGVYQIVLQIPNVTRDSPPPPEEG